MFFVSESSKTIDFIVPFTVHRDFLDSLPDAPEHQIRDAIAIYGKYVFASLLRERRHGSYLLLKTGLRQVKVHAMLVSMQLSLIVN